MTSPKTFDITCLSYDVKADIYESFETTAIVLSLIGRTSYRTKRQYRQLFPKFADELGVTSIVFDYSGHGDSPFNIDEISPAQHFLEVIYVFDFIKIKYPNHKIFVIGSSYGGYLATQLTKYRSFDGLILRAPAIYRPSDFYTKKKDEDREMTWSFRRDKDALRSHPLLTRASSYSGETLLIVHEHDEEIPPETTHAYAEAFEAEVNIQPVSHSLDVATQDQIGSYNQVMYDWIKKRVGTKK